MGLASNQHAQQNLQAALQALAARFQLSISPAYANPAEGFAGDDFINLVVGFEARCTLAELLALLKQIELRLGKDLSAPRFAPKTIDLDLLYFGTQVVRHDRLQLPPQTLPMYYLWPLSQLAPQWLDPAEGRTMTELVSDAATPEQHLHAVELAPPEQTTGSAELYLEGLRVALHLGVSEAERAARQDVFLSLHLTFADLPGACGHDQVEGTVNYSTVARHLSAVLPQRSYRTIEFLAATVADEIAGWLHQVSTLKVTVHKYPQVPGLEGGAVFTLTRSLSA